METMAFWMILSQITTKGPLVPSVDLEDACLKTKMQDIILHMVA